MKTLTNIALIAAFIFGVQPQEAFSADNNKVEMAAAETGEARIGYDGRRDILTLSLKTSGDSERAVVYISNSNGQTVIKEVFLVQGRAQTFEIELAGLAGGVYNAKVVAPSFKQATRFKKK